MEGFIEGDARKEADLQANLNMCMSFTNKQIDNRATEIKIFTVI